MSRRKKSKLTEPQDALIEEKPAARTFVPQGGDDKVRTPAPIPQIVIDYYDPKGAVLDAARGGGAFYDVLKRPGVTRLWAELDDGIDFFDEENRFGCDEGFMTCPDGVDWIITNPPWSVILDWWIRGMQLADNVVYLCLVPGCFQNAKKREYEEAGFGIKTIAYVKQPPEDTPWPDTGFTLAAVQVQRGWKGKITEVKLPGHEWKPGRKKNKPKPKAK